MVKSSTLQTASEKKTTKSATKPAAKKTAARVQSSTLTKAAAAKSAIDATPKPVVVTSSSVLVTDPALKKKELIDTVTERSGIKKKDAKPVIEAMLEVLGETLAEGREMNLQPLGKIKINRTKEVQGGNVLIVKVRQSSRVPGSGRASDVDAAG